MNSIFVTSPSFENGGNIPIKHTGFGEDVSPEFTLCNTCRSGVSIAVTLDDIDVPFVGRLNHWVIWNIPKTDIIPENIPGGETVESLSGAVQGVGWGIHRYRGPKQPPFIHKAHRYVFSFYVLDTFIELDGSADKKRLLLAMDGHIVQSGNLMGIYKPQ